MFRNDADPKRSLDDWKSNVRFDGSGETGRIMGLFVQHKMIESAGRAEANIPAYNRRLWDDRGSFMAAPTLRSLTDIAVTVIATVLVPGPANLLASVALNMVDDAVFTTLDISNGMNPLDAMEGFAKKAATSYVSGRIGAAFNDAGGLLNKSMLGDNVIGKSLMKGIELTSINATSSAVNAFDLRGALTGGDMFNEDAFLSGTFGSSATTGVLASMTGYGVTEGLGKWTLESSSGIGFMGKSGAIGVEGIQSFNSTMGSLTTAAIGYAATGTATLNLANTSMFGLKNVNGGIASTGLFELRLSKTGISSAIGMGGQDVNLGKILQSIQGASDVANITSMKMGSLQERLSLDFIAMYDSTDNFGAHALARELFEGDATIELGSGSDVVNGKVQEYLGKYDHDKPTVITISEKMIGDMSKKDLAMAAAVASHEGAHMGGIHTEAEAYAQSYDTYGQIATNLGLEGNGLFALDMALKSLDPVNEKENDSSIEYFDPNTANAHAFDYVMSVIKDQFPTYITIANLDILGKIGNYVVNTAQDLAISPDYSATVRLISPLDYALSKIDLDGDAKTFVDLLQAFRKDPSKDDPTKQLKEMSIDTLHLILNSTTPFGVESNDGKINGFSVNYKLAELTATYDEGYVETKITAHVPLPIPIFKIVASASAKASINIGPFPTVDNQQSVVIQQGIDILRDYNPKDKFIY